MKARFSRNMGQLDRLLRGIISLVLIYVGFVATHLVDNAVINLLLGLLGVINLVAALTASCPFYSLANISTRKDPNSSS